MRPWPKSYRDLAVLVGPKIRVHAEKNAPNEACGVIWPDGSITRLPNESLTPSRSFLMSKRAVSLARADKGMNPVALYHSHPGSKAIPSDADKGQLRDLAATSYLPVMFIHGKDGLRAWTWEDGEAVEVDLGGDDE